MRALFLTTGPQDDPSGRVRVMQYLAPLRAAGWQADWHPALTRQEFQTWQTAWARRDQKQILGLEFQIAPHVRLGDLRRARRYDVVVIQRNILPLFLPVLEHGLCRLSRCTVFDYDDMLLGTPDVPMLISQGRQGWKRHLVKNRMGSVVSAVSGVIAGSPYLYQRSRELNPNSFLIPSSVDLTHYVLRRAVPSDGIVRIGWRGGASTALYLQELLPVFERLWDKYGARIRVIVNAHRDFRLFGPYMELRPFQLETEIADLHEFDIGLMPLRDTEFVWGKCAFKAIEYMSAGIPGISSPYGAITSIVQEGQNGLYARTTDEWLAKLEYLIENPDERLRLGQAGRATVEQGYSVQANAPKLMAALAQLAA